MTYVLFLVSFYLLTVALMWLFGGEPPRSVGKILILISQVITLVVAIVAIINFFTLFNPLKIVLR